MSLPRGEGWVPTRRIKGQSEGVFDLGQYFFGTFVYFVIPKTKHPDTFSLQGLRPLGIALGLLRIGMDAAVQLDGQLGFMAIKIQDKRTDGVLPPEFGPA